MTVVYIVTGHWSYEDEQGWTIDAVCGSRAGAQGFIDALPRERYSRSDASWSFQIEEHQVLP